jgi:hypothetical protein
MRRRVAPLGRLENDVRGWGIGAGDLGLFFDLADTLPAEAGS